MRKINSVGYGHYVLLVIVLLLVVFPLVLWLAFLLFGAAALLTAAKISGIAGGLLGLAFAVFLAVELRQDRKLNRFYNGIKNEKLSVGGEKYECPNCGNRNIGSMDKSCSMCGIRFEN
jgi:hypothetical protein